MLLQEEIETRLYFNCIFIITATMWLLMFVYVAITGWCDRVCASVNIYGKSKWQGSEMSTRRSSMRPGAQP